MFHHHPLFPRGDKTFGQFLREVKTHAIQAFQNQDYQFDTLVESLKIERDPSRNPLFDVSFVVQNMDIPQLETKKLRFTPFQAENKTTKFDLFLQAVEMEDTICTIKISPLWPTNR